MNKAILIGRLTKDVETRYSQTNNTMILIERRSKLYKCSLYVIIILEFITIIIILIRKLIKLFK